MTNKMLEAALEYLAKGWSVIPCHPGQKKASVSWEKYQTRLPTREEATKWWTQSPTSNIALITGRISGVVGVDVDTYKGGKPEPIFERSPTQLISRTPRGGFHLVYAYPKHLTELSNEVGSDGHHKGVDIRGDGGYICIPPSYVAEYKGDYKWVRTGEPGEFPEWILDNEEVFDAESDSSDKWLSRLLQGTESGGRNDACARLAGYFAGKGVNLDVALLTILDWNRKNRPPLTADEVDTTVRSVYKGERKRGKQKVVGPPAKFNVTKLDSYMLRHGEARIQWDIEDWLPAQTVAFVVSPPGSYKTWMILDLAVSIATGKPFLGHFAVEDPGPVIVIQQEDFHGQVAERIATVANSRLGLTVPHDLESDLFEAPGVPDIPIFLHEDRLLRFDNESILTALEQQISVLRPKLVILDPLYSAGSTDDYMAKTAEKMFVFKRLRDKYQCSFLVAHHTKKGAQGIERQDLWGSQFLNAFLESGWQVRKDSETSIIVRRHFKVKGASKDLKILFDVQTEHPARYNVSFEEGDFAEGSDIVQCIEKFGAMSPTEISLKLGVHRSTISRKITPLVQAGMLVKGESGKYAIPDLPEF